MSETHWDRATREALAANAARDGRLAARKAAEAAERERVAAPVTWLTGVLDVVERIAHASSDGPWRWIDPHELQGPGGREVLWVNGAGPEPALVSDEIDRTHIALHAPHSALARVEAERAVIALHRPDGHGAVVACEVCDQWLWEGGHTSPPGAMNPWPCPTLRWLAYGHRFDAPGWLPEWAPNEVQETS